MEQELWTKKYPKVFQRKTVLLESGRKKFEMTTSQ
jgi:hypothetical protein